MKELIKKAIESIFSRFPLTNTIIFESYPDVSDSSEVLFKYFLEKKVDEKYKIVWILSGINSNDYPKGNNVYYYKRNASLFEKVKITYILNTAKYIFDSNDYIYKKRNSQIRIHLGHGMPLKYSAEYSKNLGEVDGVLVTSDVFREHYMKKCMVKDKHVLSLGLPRNDYICQKIAVKQFEGKKVIVWMPTYRQHQYKTADLDIISEFGLPCVSDVEQLKKLEQVLLTNNVLLLIRLHPAQNTSLLKDIDIKNIHLANDEYLKEKEIKLYQILSATDALITDYSSIYYDYLLTDKPIGLTINDIDEFKNVYNIIYDDFEKNIVGQHIHNFEQLIDFIEDIANGNDKTKEIRLQAKKRFHKYEDLFTQRVYEYLKDNYHL